MKLNLFYHALCGIMLLLSFSSHAQKTISGTLTDDANQPLGGAKVTIFGTSTSTIADANGNYILPVTSYPVKLEISFEDYVTTAVFQGVSEKANPTAATDVANQSASQLQTVNSTLRPRMAGTNSPTSGHIAPSSIAQNSHQNPRSVKTGIATSSSINQASARGAGQ